MYIPQEIPLIRHKMVCFVGTSELEIPNETEIHELVLALKGFLFSLQSEKAQFAEFSATELEEFYNAIYAALQDFSKMQNKLQTFDYFGNTLVRQYFEALIGSLKQFRKDLLKIIEGELVEHTKTISQKNMINSLKDK